MPMLRRVSLGLCIALLSTRTAKFYHRQPYGLLGMVKGGLWEMGGPLGRATACGRSVGVAPCVRRPNRDVDPVRHCLPRELRDEVQHRVDGLARGRSWGAASWAHDRWGAASCEDDSSEDDSWAYDSWEAASWGADSWQKDSWQTANWNADKWGTDQSSILCEVGGPAAIIILIP